MRSMKIGKMKKMRNAIGMMMVGMSTSTALSGNDDNIDRDNDNNSRNTTI